MKSDKILIGKDKVMKRKLKLKVTINSPVILSFTLICLVSLVLNTITGGVNE